MGKHKRTLPRELLQTESVPVYLMADQEYCELKVDIEIKHPEVEEQVRVGCEFMAKYRDAFRALAK